MGAYPCISTERQAQKEEQAQTPLIHREVDLMFHAEMPNELHLFFYHWMMKKYFIESLAVLSLTGKKPEARVMQATLYVQDCLLWLRPNLGECYPGWSRGVICAWDGAQGQKRARAQGSLEQLGTPC